MLLEPGPYPWTRADARELHLILTYAYPEEEDALFLADKVGIKSVTLKRRVSVIHLWRQILDRASLLQTGLRRLLELARDERPDGAERALLDAILAGEEVPMRSEPRKADGSAQFNEGTEEVSRNEALLFKDDLTIATDEVASLIETLERLLPLSRSVCLLQVESVGDNGLRRSVGTGFRIGPRHVLTNHHVLFVHGTRATKVDVVFGFDQQSAGNAVKLAGEPSSIVAEAADDWGVIEVGGMTDWPIVDVRDIAEPVKGEAAYVLQHPAGGVKRLAYVRNTITDCSDHVVQYLSDTQPGSSGAPVFNAAGKLLAIHHRGGTPCSLTGKSPMCKNEGIRSSRVLDALRRHGLVA